MTSRHYMCYTCSGCMSVAKTYCSVLIDPSSLEKECIFFDNSKFCDVFNSYCGQCGDLRMQVPGDENKLDQLSYLKRKVDTLKCCNLYGLVNATSP
jgi:hypothetical protein